MTLRPNVRSRRWIVARPFSLPTWVAIAITLLGLTLVLAVMKWLKNNQDSFASTLWPLTFLLVRVMLKQSSSSSCSCNSRGRETSWQTTSNTYKAYLLLSAWLFLSFILSNAYLCVFFSILTLPELNPSVNTVDDLLHLLEEPKAFGNFPNHQQQLTLVATTLFYDMLRGGTSTKTDSIDELFQQLSSKVSRHHHRLVSIDNYRSTEESFRAVAQYLPGVVWIGNRIAYEGIAGQFRPKQYGPLFHLSSEAVLGLDVFAIGLAKGSPLLGPFDRAIQQFHEAGLLQRFLEQSLSSHGDRTSEGYAPELIARFHSFVPERESSFRTTHLSLEGLYSVWVLWSVGVIISSLAFLLGECCFASVRWEKIFDCQRSPWYS